MWDGYDTEGILLPELFKHRKAVVRVKELVAVSDAYLGLSSESSTRLDSFPYLSVIARSNNPIEYKPNHPSAHAQRGVAAETL